MTTNLNLKNPTLRSPYMKMQKLGKVWKPSKPQIQIKAERVKFPMPLIEVQIVKDNFQLVRMELLPFKGLWIVRRLLDIK